MISLIATMSALVALAVALRREPVRVRVAAGRHGR